jgi:hypothetical protein
MKLNDLQEKWMKEPAYKQAYDALEEEFALAACRTEVLKFRGGAGFSASRGRLTSYRG